jgi:hypothetical protein
MFVYGGRSVGIFDEMWRFDYGVCGLPVSGLQHVAECSVWCCVAVCRLAVVALVADSER